VIHLSHLAFHHIFRGKDNPDCSYFWLEPQFNEMVREQIAAFLLHVAEENESGDIPYSYIYRGKSIDESGKYVSSGVGSGLTCATYILAIFEALQISMIDLQTWPAGRPADVQWALDILDLLAKSQPPATAEHIATQRAELPNVVRYRPEEIGAAFTELIRSPLTFAQVEPLSVELLAQLSPPPPQGA